MAGRGLTADGDAQLHTAPLRQLHVEGAATRDDRLWVQTDVDPRETQPHIYARPAGRDQPHPASYTRETWRPRHMSWQIGSRQPSHSVRVAPGTGTQTSRLPAGGSPRPSPTQLKSSDDFLSLSWLFSHDLSHQTQATSPVVTGFYSLFYSWGNCVLSKVTRCPNHRTRILT